MGDRAVETSENPMAPSQKKKPLGMREAADVDQPPRHLGDDVGDPLGDVIHCELDGVLPRLYGGEWVG